MTMNSVTPTGRRVRVTRYEPITCGDCRFSGEGREGLECRYKPPTVTKGFPKVRADEDWCSNHQMFGVSWDEAA